MNGIRSIIDLWPTQAAFAQDIGAKSAAVHNMITRDKISGDHWGAAVVAARRRGIEGLTLDCLATAARGVTCICTEDGTWLVRDNLTGRVASGRSLCDALSELWRVLFEVLEAA